MSGRRFTDQAEIASCFDLNKVESPAYTRLSSCFRGGFTGHCSVMLLYSCAVLERPKSGVGAWETLRAVGSPYCAVVELWTLTAF
jgi:hypothetical protein